MPTFSYAYACAPNIWLRVLVCTYGQNQHFFRHKAIVQRFLVRKKPKILPLGYLEAKYGARASGSTLW